MSADITKIVLEFKRYQSFGVLNFNSVCLQYNTMQTLFIVGELQLTYAQAVKLQKSKKNYQPYDNVHVLKNTHAPNFTESSILAYQIRVSACFTCAYKSYLTHVISPGAG